MFQPENVNLERSERSVPAVTRCFFWITSCRSESGSHHGPGANGMLDRGEGVECGTRKITSRIFSVVQRVSTDPSEITPNQELINTFTVYETS